MAVSTPGLAAPGWWNTPANDTVPNVVNISMMARDSPASPTRLAMNAFLAATAAAGLCCQNPISR